MIKIANTLHDVRALGCRRVRLERRRCHSAIGALPVHVTPHLLKVPHVVHRASPIGRRGVWLDLCKPLLPLGLRAPVLVGMDTIVVTIQVLHGYRPFRRIRVRRQRLKPIAAAIPVATARQGVEVSDVPHGVRALGCRRVRLERRRCHSAIGALPVHVTPHLLKVPHVVHRASPIGRRGVWLDLCKPLLPLGLRAPVLVHRDDVEASLQIVN
mmetsp:Transcript_14909/g.38189  ORF Transcript_14909/g.38189 Transcript_14909/m.38189 type:complete len:212 (+) Transcript_14909:2222-2857(+)